MPELAYVNNEIVPIDEARIPVRDRGFIFGDGVYDVARVYGGKVHRPEAHLGRLLRCARQLELLDVPQADEVEQIIDTLLEGAELDDAMIYMQLTRGVAPRQSAYPQQTPATLLVTVEEVRRGADKRRDEGVSAILVEDIRWARNDIKTVNLLPKVLMGERANRAGVYEALYRDGDANVWEGTATNLFAVFDRVLRTAPECSRILSGTTRADVLGLADDLGYEVELEAMHDDEIFEADELFLTGTLTEVQGLVELDGKRIGSGAVGPMTRSLQNAYDELVDNRVAAMK